jgi:dihydroorotate dehydrogenase electron transfer subunit
MKVKIVSSKELSPGYVKLVLAPHGELDGGQPGQFVMLRGRWENDPLLGRPFSVYRFRGDGGGIQLLIRVVGRGTRYISQLGEGDEIDVFGPLGRGFPPPPGGARALLVAGGIGVAPLMALAESLSGERLLIMGGKSKDDVVYIEDDVSDIQLPLRYATEDGSFGEKGTAVSLMREVLSANDNVYTCGPTGMLSEIAREVEKRGNTAYISTEETMACGIGACLGCATEKSGGGYLLTCHDGPVFKSGDIDWEKKGEC